MQTQQNILAEVEAKLKAGDQEGAKKILNDLIVNQELTNEEKAELYVKLTTVLLQAQNTISESYLAELEKTVQQLEKIDEAERKVNDKVNLQQVRNKLNDTN